MDYLSSGIGYLFSNFPSTSLTHSPPTELDVAKQKLQSLWKAVELGNVEEVRTLLEVVPDGVMTKDEDDSTLLHCAACFGKEEVVKLLIQKGSKVNYKNKYWTTPLHVACFNGNVESARILVANEADTNAWDTEDHTPLHGVAVKGHLEVAKLLLLEKKIKLNCADNNGQTPLHTAVYNGHLEIARLLIRNGAALNPQNYAGQTPLHRAASSQLASVEMLKLLLDNGGDPKIRDNIGYTPLDAALDVKDASPASVEKKSILSELMKRIRPLADIMEENGIPADKAKQYADLFLQNDLDVTMIPNLDDARLKEIGISSMGHRVKILKIT